MSIPLNTRQWSPTNALKDAPGALHEVPVGSIELSQYHLDNNKVSKIADAIKGGKAVPPPVGSFAKGRVQIQDGHHRVAAAMAAGKKTVQVRIY